MLTTVEVTRVDVLPQNFAFIVKSEFIILASVSVPVLFRLLRLSTQPQAPSSSIQKMVYLHFPANPTEEELMLQAKYNKLKRKVFILLLHR